MTPEERARLHEQTQRRGMFCLDLSHHDAQEMADVMARDVPLIAATLRERAGNSHYLLVLFPITGEDDVILTPLADLPMNLDKLWLRAEQDTTIRLTIVPRHLRINDLFAALQTNQPIVPE
jgi:hypothetical protein